MKRLFATFGLALGAWLAPVPAAAAIIVSFNPSSQHINVGDTTTVDVNISGLGAEVLSAIDVDLLFNQAIIGNFAVTHFVVPEFGGLGNSYFNTNFGSGRTEVIDGSLLSDPDLQAAQGDAFTILRFSFQGIADGFSLLQFGPDPDFERNFVGLNALSLQVDVGTACIAVGTGQCPSAVPEPSSLALFGLVLAGALVPAALRRRRGRITT